MIWYPYEQMKTMKEPYRILDAEGVHLYTKDQKLIDSISSWWCMIHGYKHPELTAAIKEQADRFCHVMLGGLTHEPVEKLSDKLQEFLPGDLDYCFFSDSGSVAVEVSLKMALQYNTNQGRKRPLVLALEHAYHGDTFKAMEVGDDEDYHFAFDKKEGVVHIPTEIPALEEAFELYVERLQKFREELEALQHLKILRTEHYDISKVVISTANANITSPELAERLRKEYHLEMEMTGGTYVLAMTTVADTQEGLDRLKAALLEIDGQLEAKTAVSGST